MSVDYPVNVYISTLSIVMYYIPIIMYYYYYCCTSLAAIIVIGRDGGRWERGGRREEIEF